MCSRRTQKRPAFPGYSCTKEYRIHPVAKDLFPCHEDEIEKFARDRGLLVEKAGSGQGDWKSYEAGKLLRFRGVPESGAYEVPGFHGQTIR
jgi:hypothetical protein